MKVGDLVTWTQREDLRQWPPPYCRLGLIFQRKENHIVRVGDKSRPFEVLWLQSRNKTWNDEEGLEIVSEAR